MTPDDLFFLNFTVPAIGVLVGLVIGSIAGFIEGRTRATGKAAAVVVLLGGAAVATFLVNTHWHFLW